MSAEARSGAIHEHRNRGTAKNFFGARTKQSLLETRSAMGSQDDQVNVAILDKARNRVPKVEATLNKSVARQACELRVDTRHFGSCHFFLAVEK